MPYLMTSEHFIHAVMSLGLIGLHAADVVGILNGTALHKNVGQLNKRH